MYSCGIILCVPCRDGAFTVAVNENLIHVLFISFDFPEHWQYGLE